MEERTDSRETPVADGASVIFQNTLVRVGVLGIVLVVLLIPTWMVEDVIREREGRRGEAVREVSMTWGGAQTMGGPVLTLPFEEKGKDADGKAVTRDRFWHILPKELKIEGTAEPRLLRRGLFQVPLYRTHVSITGRFVPWSKPGAPNPSTVRWDGALVTLPLSETRGLIEQVVLTWDGGKTELATDALEGAPTDRGLRAKLDGLRREVWDKGFNFRVDLLLQGSESLRFFPLGEYTTVSLQSSWSAPGFVGGFLPVERTVSRDGFQALWQIPGLARGFPQQWQDRGNVIPEWDKAAFGVRLVVPVDHYQQSSRSVKYAALFLLLTFALFFLFELLLRARLHPMNYILVGCAMCLFYLLLVALSERMPFGASYWIASTATITLIALYTVAIMHSGAATAGLVGFLGCLYGYLYVLLRLEDSSLLLGAVALFVILAVFMYLTRNLNWFNLSAGAPRSGRDASPPRRSVATPIVRRPPVSPEGA